MSLSQVKTLLKLFTSISVALTFLSLVTLLLILNSTLSPYFFLLIALFGLITGRFLYEIISIKLSIKEQYID